MGTFTHIVIGAGAVGSAAAFWLSQRPGTRVLVVEQFDLVNSRGSSGDHSRIIRHSYHSPVYTRLTPAAYETWRRIESLTGLPILLKTGGLDLAGSEPAHRAELDAYRRSLTDAGISFDDLDAATIRRRFPQWRIDDDVTGMYQSDAGLIDIRRSVSAHTSLALAAGVTFLPHTRVTGIDLHADAVTVRTADSVHTAGHLVVAAASWLGELMPDLGIEFALTLSQEQVSYFASPRLADFSPARFPIWVYHGAETMYGFPVYGEAGVKVARDMRGRFIASEERVFEGDDAEADLLRGFLRAHLPDAVGPTLISRTCVYDMPADREFVLDVLPEHPHVAVFCGAGHGGKFASLVGSILADLLTTGSTAHPIEAFRLTRPAIVDPSFPPSFRLTS